MKIHWALLGALCEIAMSAANAAEDHSGHLESTQDISGEPTESEHAHVPPPPPQHVMGEMSKERMVELMQMEDDAAFGMLSADELEWRQDDTAAWEVHAWYGRDYDKLWLKTEGESISGEESGRAELLWDRIVSKWWSVQAGLRQDFGPGPSRSWAAVGLQGLAPHFFEIEAALYVGDSGRTAARFSIDYDVLLTQRLILQPQFELDAYGKQDPENGIGSGLSHMELGLRLRYELCREFAPYVGLTWERKLGDTADLASSVKGDDSDTSIVLGFRAWY